MRQRSAGEADAAMAKQRQVLHCLVDPVRVVDFKNQRTWSGDSYINGDQGSILGDQLIEKMAFGPECHYGDALNLALSQASNENFRAFPVVVRRTDHHFEVILSRDILKTLNQFREEWICDFRN